MEKKRKAYEKKIKEQMIRQGEDPVKVASLYIEFPKNDKNKENNNRIVLKRKIIRFID